MGTPPVMVDIMPRISGVEFDDAWQRRVEVAIDDALTVPFISRADLLAAKISAGRAQDLADVVALRDSAESAIGYSPAMEDIQRTRAQGREDWLRMRRGRQSEKSSDERSSDLDGNDPKKDPGMGIDDELES
jgi:hypothetical protein